MFKDFKDQIYFEIICDGLCIQIVDVVNWLMFDFGSVCLQLYFEDILLVMVEIICQVLNKISISGYIDVKFYVGNGDFGNWELLVNCVNVVCCVLVVGGYLEGQIVQVVGYVLVCLFDDKDLLNLVNWWIDIVVLICKVQKVIEGEIGVFEVSVFVVVLGEQLKLVVEVLVVGV